MPSDASVGNLAVWLVHACCKEFRSDEGRLTTMSCLKSYCNNFRHLHAKHLHAQIYQRMRKIDGHT